MYTFCCPPHIWYLLIFSFCTEKNTSLEKEIRPVIEVKEAFSEKAKIGVNDFAASIKYIPLETKDNCLVGNYTEVFVDKQNVIVISFRQIFVFDRETGKFIREIGTYGKGPGEYRNTVFNAFNQRNKTIRTKGWNNNIIEYDLHGQIKRDVSFPIYVSSVIIEMESDIYAGYTPNISGNGENKLLIFDALGNEISLIKNKDFYKKEVPGRIISFGNEAQFYIFQKKTYFKEIFNDTVYHISDNSLKAEYTFNTDGLSPYYALKGENEAYDKLRSLFRIQNIFETEEFLFFMINHENKKYAGYYNKFDEKTLISNFTDEDENGFYDDFNNFISFIPQRINSENEIIGHIDARIITEYCGKHRNNIDKLPTNLRGIRFNDNPIVVIADLK